MRRRDEAVEQQEARTWVLNALKRSRALNGSEAFTRAERFGSAS
jgi:glutamine synthetase adenylyltransferase